MRGVLHGGVACNASSGLSRARRELLLELRGAARDLGALRRGDLRVYRELLSQSKMLSFSAISSTLVE